MLGALQRTGTVGKPATLLQVFMAGAGSGFVNSFISCPFELAKINMQNQGVLPGTRTSAPHASLATPFQAAT